MTLEDYPEDIEIKKTNFKTDQQEAAAETIADAWPADLETVAEEGQHVKVFYSQVLDQFLGPTDTEMTFSDIQSEYGSVSQWAEADTEDESADDDPEIDDIEPGDESRNGTPSESDGQPTETTASTTAEPDIPVDVAASAPENVDGGVDDQRRAWFAAGFRDGVEFALRNPDLFDRSEE